VYRAAWSPERAFALLEDEVDGYDQRVVAALQRVITPEPAPSWVADLGTRAVEAAGTVVPAPRRVPS